MSVYSLDEYFYLFNTPHFLDNSFIILLKA